MLSLSVSSWRVTLSSAYAVYVTTVTFTLVMRMHNNDDYAYGLVRFVMYLYRTYTLHRAVQMSQNTWGPTQEVMLSIDVQLEHPDRR